MTPKPPKPQPLPPAVPPKFRVVVTDSAETLKSEVNAGLEAGQMVEPSTTQLNAIAGIVVLSQACARDPTWEKRVRTRNSTQKVLNTGGVF